MTDDRLTVFRCQDATGSLSGVWQGSLLNHPMPIMGALFKNYYTSLMDSYLAGISLISYDATDHFPRCANHVRHFLFRRCLFYDALAVDYFR